MIKLFTTHLHKNQNIIGDHKEGFYIGIELPKDNPEAQRTFYGPNLWPDSGNSNFKIQLLVVGKITLFA